MFYYLSFDTSWIYQCLYTQAQWVNLSVILQEDLSRSQQPPIGTSRPGELKRLHRSPDPLLREMSRPAINGRGVAEQSCRVQLSVMQTLSSRLQLQEQRGRRLEAVLAQHQNHSERLQQHHHEEVAALRTALQNSQARLQHSLRAYDEQVRPLYRTS